MKKYILPIIIAVLAVAVVVLGILIYSAKSENKKYSVIVEEYKSSSSVPQVVITP